LINETIAFQFSAKSVVENIGMHRVDVSIVKMNYEEHHIDVVEIEKEKSMNEVIRDMVFVMKYKSNSNQIEVL
jgi:hypothetical protein